MVKSVFTILGAAAVAGFALTPGVASAATAAPAALAHSSSPAAADPDTTVTFTVTTGLLSLTAPANVDLGSGTGLETGLPGTTISGPVGDTVVTDDRAALTAIWTATASATDWTTGGSTPNETIPVGDVGYDPGAITTTGTVTATGFPITLSNAAQTVVTGTGVIGDNTATWDPTLSVAVPGTVVGGVYTGTLTQSVS